MAKKLMSRKKLLVFIILFLLVLLIGLGAFLYLDYVDDKLLNAIKEKYSKYVEVVDDTMLYTKKGEEIGKISKGFKLALKDKKIVNTDQKYFQIKDSNYFVYYADIVKSEMPSKKEIESNYIVFNKNITGDKVVFYSDDKVVLEINDKVSLPIQYMDSNYYYVYYFDELLKVKRDKEDKIIDSENTTAQEANYISVINYEAIDSCTNNGCVSVDNIKQQLNSFKEQGFYSISLDVYKAWLDGNIRLKEKAVLLTTNTNNDNVNNIVKEYGIKLENISDSGLKFTSVNKKSTRESAKDNIQMYTVKKNTTLESFKKMLLGEDVYEVVKTNNEQKIAVLNYHFFYDSSLGESCNENICLEASKFREHLEYFKNNGYKTLRMSEFKQWMYGEIELPEKSVLITIDDGAMGTGAHNGNKVIPLLEEYDMYATLFLIAGWWNIENYKSDHLDIQSHTYDMHQYGTCGKGQLVCYSKEDALADLRTSLDIIGNNDSFCYPFYSYSNTAIEAVKEAGFKLAFIGGSVKARRSNNKFLIPRYPIYKNITMNQFIQMVS